MAHFPVGFIKLDVEGMEIGRHSEGRKRPGLPYQPTSADASSALQVAIYGQRQAHTLKTGLGSLTDEWMDD